MLYFNLKVPETLSATVTIPEFITNGMEAVKLAPSAMNRQNPTLHFKNDAVTMSVNLGARFDLVDLGIAMKHFEIGAGNGKFELKKRRKVANILNQKML